MGLQEHLNEARARREAAFANGHAELRTAIADTLSQIAECIRTGAANVAIIAQAQNFCQRVQLGAEASAAFYELVAEGPEATASLWRLYANVDGVSMPAGTFANFDDASRHLSGIYRRKGVPYSIDRVSPGRFVSRPFRVGRAG